MDILCIDWLYKDKKKKIVYGQIGYYKKKFISAINQKCAFKITPSFGILSYFINIKNLSSFYITVLFDG